MADLEDFATTVGTLIKGRTPLPPPTISIDADGVPYWNPTSGTHYIYRDVDGVPYFAASPWLTPGTDTDGVPTVS